MSIRRVFTFTFIVVTTITLCFGSALMYERRSTERAAQNYISIWEDEIVKTLVEKQDKDLLEKIVSQLKLVSASIDTSKVSLLSDSFKFMDSYSIQKFQIPLALNYMTVGMVETNLSFQRLAVATLVSPLFLVTAFLVLSAAMLIWRRDEKARYQQRTLEQKFQLQTEIAQMARQVAHDIRGPLSALQAIANKDGAIANSYKDLFSQGSDRIQKIAEDLLTFSRGSLQNSANPSESKAMSISKVMRSLNNEFAIKTPTIRWNLDLVGESNVRLEISETKLSNILSNLLQNAIEANATAVDMQVVSKAKELVVSIRDDGKGIPENILPRLFQEELTYGKANGNGIGLKAAKDNIEKVGGQITLVSKVNQGTLVQFRLPIEA